MGSSRIPPTMMVPGRLVANPSQTIDGGLFPFGGLEVGRVRGCALRSLAHDVPVFYEATGAVGELIEGGHRWVFLAFFRGNDSDAIETFLPDGHAEGEQTGHAVFEVPGEREPGSSALSRATVLLYVPDDTENAPAILMYAAVPDLEGDIAWNRRTEHGLPIVFECVPDEDDRVLAYGRLADLEL